MVRDWSLAADVVQTSFVALSRFGGDVAPEARKSWLFRVAHREAMRVRDRQKPYIQTSPESTASVFEAQATYEIDPLSKMADQEDIDELTKRINELPQEQQQSFNLWNPLGLIRKPWFTLSMGQVIPIARGCRWQRSLRRCC